MPPATRPAAMSRLEVSRSTAGFLLDQPVERHREEEQRQVSEREEVGAQRPAPVGAAQQPHGAVDEAGAEGHRSDEILDAEAAGAEGQLGHRIEQDRVEEDLATRLVLAADDRHHRHAGPRVLVLHQQRESPEMGWGPEEDDREEEEGGAAEAARY